MYNNYKMHTMEIAGMVFVYDSKHVHTHSRAHSAEGHTCEGVAILRLIVCVLYLLI